MPVCSPILSRSILIGILGLMQLLIGGTALASDTKKCPAILDELDYSDVRKLVELIQPRLFKNILAPLPELQENVKSLAKILKSTPLDTGADVDNYFLKREGLGPLDIAVLKPLLTENLRLRPQLLELVRAEADHLAQNPLEITYERYTLLGYRAAVALTRIADLLTGQDGPEHVEYIIRQELKALGHRTEEPSAAPLQSWHASFSERQRIKFDQILKAAPRFLFLWVSKSFQTKIIVDSYDDNVGLTDTIQGIAMVDEAWRNANNYHAHDINHAHMYLLPDHDLNWLSTITDYAEFKVLVEKRRAYKRDIQLKIDRATGDPRIFTAIWYRTFHERMGPATRGLVPTPESVRDILAKANRRDVLEHFATEINFQYKIPMDQALVLAKKAYRVFPGVDPDYVPVPRYISN